MSSSPLAEGTAVEARASSLLERIRFHAMPEGAEGTAGSRLSQRGVLRLAPDRPWLPFQAEQTFDPFRLDFRWSSRVRLAGILPLRIEDSYRSGHGELSVRLFGLPLSRSTGPEVDRGELIRALAELPWRPAFFAERPGFRWTSPAAEVLKVTYDDGTLRASVHFLVDAEGRVKGGRVARRPRQVGKGFVETDWTFTLDDYRAFEGIRVPTRAEVSWDLPEGLLTWWKGEVTAFEGR